MVIYANFSHNIRIDLTRSNITNIFSKYLHDHIICQNVGIMIWWRYFTMDIITLPHYKCENKIINIILMNPFLITYNSKAKIHFIVGLSFLFFFFNQERPKIYFIPLFEWVKRNGEINAAPSVLCSPSIPIDRSVKVEKSP